MKNAKYACYHDSYRDQALIDDFQLRGAVYDDKAISFAHSVSYDLLNNKLVVIN